MKKKQRRANLIAKIVDRLNLPRDRTFPGYLSKRQLEQILFYIERNELDWEKISEKMNGIKEKIKD